MYHWIIVLLGLGRFGHGFYFWTQGHTRVDWTILSYSGGVLSIKFRGLSGLAVDALISRGRRWGPKHPFFGHRPGWWIVFFCYWLDTTGHLGLHETRIASHVHHMPMRIFFLTSEEPPVACFPSTGVKCLWVPLVACIEVQKILAATYSALIYCT